MSWTRCLCTIVVVALGASSVWPRVALAQSGSTPTESKNPQPANSFQEIKAHYDAALQAIDAMTAAQAQLAHTPKDQQPALQSKITDAGSTAVAELSAALQLMKPDDPNRPTVLSQLGLVYEKMNKWQEAADTYAKAIELKPTGAASYNNLGNDLARLGKIDEARAAYQKYAELDPPDAAMAWRNFGIVLSNANRMKEAIEPLQKATSLDPKNATGWYLLAVALVNTMEFKAQGTKMVPVIPPGTMKAYQNAVDLDPNGPVGEQAKQGLESLQSMMGGIDTKVDTKVENGPAAAKPKK